MTITMAVVVAVILIMGRAMAAITALVAVAMVTTVPAVAVAITTPNTAT